MNVAEYIEKNSHYEKNGNIDKLINCIESNTIGYKDIIDVWLCGLLGGNIGSLLVITGKQGVGKTEFFRRLLPESLDNNYAWMSICDDTLKDQQLLMCEKLLLITDDADFMNEQQAIAFSKLINRTGFTVRKAYEKQAINYNRTASVVCTTNGNYGDKRARVNAKLLKVNIVSIDHEAYNSIDKDELFMEIVRLNQ